MLDFFQIKNKNFYLVFSFLGFVICLSFILSSCGQDNLAKGKVPESADDEVRRLMNAGDYESAIEKLLVLVDNEPETYNRFALLGAAYAAISGVSILDMIKSQFSASNSAPQGNGLISQVGSFLPSNPTRSQLSNLRSGMDWLENIPAALRGETTEESYGKSASLQLSLYSAAYSVMYMSQFVAPTTGDFTPESLATMTDADVDNILSALRTSAASGTGPAAGMGDAVDEALAEIDQQPGATTREKLINYLDSTGQTP